MQMIHNNMTLYNKLYYYKLIPKCTHHRKNKKPTNVVVDANGMSYPKQTTLTKQPIKKGILLLSILDTVVKFYPKVFS